MGVVFSTCRDKLSKIRKSNDRHDPSSAESVEREFLRGGGDEREERYESSNINCEVCGGYHREETEEERMNYETSICPVLRQIAETETRDLMNVEEEECESDVVSERITEKVNDREEVVEMKTISKSEIWKLLGMINIEECKLPEGKIVKEECPICWDPIHHTEAESTTCGHVMHKKCLSQALDRKRECPVCMTGQQEDLSRLLQYICD